MGNNSVIDVRNKAIERHDVDSSIFQGDYEDFRYGKYTNAFIYGRHQIFEEIDRVLKNLPAGSKILDLGCGTGHFSNYMKERGYEVIGLDASSKMLEFAKKNFPNIEFVEGISAKLPFENESFDCIVCIEVLRYLHAQDVIDTYKEVYRTLTKGGIFFTTHVNTFATDGYFFFYNLKKFLNKFRGKSYHNCYFTSGGREEAILQKIGFKEINTLGRMNGSIRMAYKLHKRAAILWSKFLKIFNKDEKFRSNPAKSMAGHLIITATK